MPGDIKKAINFSASEKYPEPKIEKKNFYYANLLLEDYSGIVSELSAVMLYVYQHILSEDEFKDYAEVLSGIAIIEMKHLELLGETIKLLGLKPIYAVPYMGLYYPWNSKFVNYETDISKMIDIDIESEQQAINQYENHRMLIKDKYIKELLSRIIEDEKLHLKIFKDLKKKYDKG
ncbi:bacterioferritin [Caloramator fervidus]|uniref:Bacterioferritin n=1 Tax=Caloramator fervidus TaxID=29344 RepID=A0A1H5SNG2_9CLOT|nr:ferritin family protein [Caloramator fervidus]SEF52153.1 bacterioferritin [Caloramator fervidus]